jgi:hypothetical protein
VSDYVVAGTGPRSIKVSSRATRSAAWQLLLDRMVHLRAVHGDRLVVMSGFAEGWDEAVAKAGIEVGARLWAAVPNGGYGAWYWSAEHSLTKQDRIAEFEALLAQAWRVTYVMEDVHHTSRLHLNGRHANFLRNDWMVVGDGRGFSGAHDFLVLGPVKPKSGTADCVETIKAAGKWRDDMVLLPDTAIPGQPSLLEA